MITSKDIDEKMFEQARPGYKPEEVDEFLKEMSESFKMYENEIFHLKKEKEETKKKMIFLSDNIKKYKQDEDDISSALIFAQKQAKEIVAQANERAEEIVAKANEESERILGEIKAKTEAEKESLAAAKKEVANFRSELLSTYKEHLSLLNSIPGFEVYEDDTYETESSAEVSETEAADEAPVIVDENKAEPQEIEVSEEDEEVLIYTENAVNTVSEE